MEIAIFLLSDWIHPENDTKEIGSPCISYQQTELTLQKCFSEDEKWKWRIIEEDEIRSWLFIECYKKLPTSTLHYRLLSQIQWFELYLLLR